MRFVLAQGTLIVTLMPYFLFDLHSPNYCGNLSTLGLGMTMTFSCL